MSTILGAIQRKVKANAQQENDRDLLQDQINRLGYFVCKPQEISMLIQLSSEIGFDSIFERLRAPERSGWLVETILSDVASEIGFSFGRPLKPLMDKQQRAILQKFTSEIPINA